MRLSAVSCLLAVLTYPLGTVASVSFNTFSAAAPAAKGPTPPSQDPFYQAPAGFEKKAPGTILRHRPVPHPLLVGPTLNAGYYKAAYQILYRTTDGLGNPQASLSTLIVPKSPNPKRLLSYQTFYDAADVDCSPSYTLQQGQSNLNIEGVIISTALRQHWYVVVPDYEGPDAAFTVGRQAGRATLDAIRSAIKSGAFSGISSTPEIGMFGYSGGALASEWAVELQPTYAPKLKITAAAFGGLTPNVTSVILSVNGKSNSDLIPKGTLGFANQYKNVTAFLNRSLKPAKARQFKTALRKCSTPKLSGKNIFTYFKQGRAVIDAPILKSVVNQNGIMGRTNTPTIPLYIYKSTGDEVSRVADTDALVKKYCAHGASIRYIRNHYGTHETQFIISLPHALTWLKQRFEGKTFADGCETRNQKLSKLNPNSKYILGDTVYQELKSELASMEGGS